MDLANIISFTKGKEIETVILMTKITKQKKSD